MSELAKKRGDTERANTHTVTINRLATGTATLTQEWMIILGEVFGIAPTEIISPPIAENLRRVTVVVALAAGAWRKDWQLPDAEQHDIMIPNAPELAELALYAGEIRGDDINRRYPHAAIVVLSRFEPGAVNRPNDLKDGTRYHVRITRADGMIEDSIKTLTIDAQGALWLKPESDRPQFQEWTPLRPGASMDIVGKVRGVFFREA